MDISCTMDKDIRIYPRIEIHFSHTRSGFGAADVRLFASSKSFRDVIVMLKLHNHVTSQPNQRILMFFQYKM